MPTRGGRPPELLPGVRNVPCAGLTRLASGAEVLGSLGAAGGKSWEWVLQGLWNRGWAVRRPAGRSESSLAEDPGQPDGLLSLV